MDKNGYCRNRVLSFAWDLGVIFLAMPIFQDLRFPKSFFKKIQILGIIEKCMGCFLVYLFLEVFLLKSAKKMRIYDCVKNRFGTFKNPFFDVKKGYKQVIAPGSCKTYCFLFDTDT